MFASFASFVLVDDDDNDDDSVAGVLVLVLVNVSVGMESGWICNGIPYVELWFENVFIFICSDPSHPLCSSSSLTVDGVDLDGNVGVAVDVNVSY